MRILSKGFHYFYHLIINYEFDKVIRTIYRYWKKKTIIYVYGVWDISVAVKVYFGFTSIHFVTIFSTFLRHFGFTVDRDINPSI